MYIFNFQQQGTAENFLYDWQLVADDDNTPIDYAQCIVYVQCWARSARGSGDQSQFNWNWPYTYSGFNAVPVFSGNTRDGTGILTLYKGTLEINVPAATMQRLLPGWYEVGFLISEPDGSTPQQLAVGTLPIYNSGVWNGPPSY